MNRKMAGKTQSLKNNMQTVKEGKKCLGINYAFSEGSGFDIFDGNWRSREEMMFVFFRPGG